MKYLPIVWIALGATVLLALITAAVLFLKIFYAVRKKTKDPEAFSLPEGEVYEPHHEQMIRWIKEIRAMERKSVSVTSFDGLTLHGMYYEVEKGAPTEILFHGYRGNAERDLCGGVHRCL